MTIIIVRFLLLILVVAYNTEARTLKENCDKLKADGGYGKAPRPPPPAPKVAPPTKETLPLHLYTDTNKFSRPTIAPPPPPNPSAIEAGQLIVTSFGTKWNKIWIIASNGYKRPSLSPPPAPRAAPPIHYLSGGHLALSRQSPPNILSSSA